MKFRLSLVSASLLLGALPVALYTPAACAAETPHAALVVDTGESALTYCVELPDDSVSGIELIELAGEQHGLQYSFGYGGEAVCVLAGVGPEGDDCFADYPDFWGYWRGNDSGDWAWASTGAGTTSVEAGDIEGWSWGSGADGDTHPPPPATTFEAICGAPAPGSGGGNEEPDEASVTDGDGDDGSSSQASGSAERPSTTSGGDEAAGEPRERTAPDGRSDPAEQRESSTTETQSSGTDTAEQPAPEEPEPHVALVARSGAREEPGPPIVGLVGLGLAIGLGITAAAMTAGRRRNRGT